MSKLPSVKSLTYLQLLNFIRSEIADGKRIIAQTGAVKHWNIGKAIGDYVLNGKDRANYGERVFENLARDLKISKRTLEQTVQFYRKFPIPHARAQLSWTHFRELLVLPDLEERKRLLSQVREKNLTTRELHEEIKKKNLIIPSEGKIPQLKFVRGKLYTYRIIEFRPTQPGQIERHIDCGFQISYGPKAAQLASFKTGQIVQTTKLDSKTFSVHSSERGASDVFTFKGSVSKIIDGDTLVADVDLGFRIFKEQKLRLRSIDCPELSTPAGQAAKKFVEERINVCKFLIVKTYKDDKYGRYLADVFYKIGEADPVQVALCGNYLNQELLDARLAVKC